MGPIITQIQEQRNGLSLPIALGHAISVALVAGVLWLAEAALPDRALRWGAAAILFGFGLYRLSRSRHPSWVGMRVGFRDLVLWSFLMASAHGAGLMLVPVLLGCCRGMTRPPRTTTRRMLVPTPTACHRSRSRAPSILCGGWPPWGCTPRATCWWPA